MVTTESAIGDFDIAGHSPIYRATSLHFLTTARTIGVDFVIVIGRAAAWVTRVVGLSVSIVIHAITALTGFVIILQRGTSGVISINSSIPVIVHTIEALHPRLWYVVYKLPTAMKVIRIDPQLTIEDIDLASGGHGTSRRPVDPIKGGVHTQV